MPIPDSLLGFWNAFVDAAAAAGTRELADATRFHSAFHFGDSPALADELLALVLQGTKRATTGAVWAFEAEGHPLPRRGDLSIVNDGAGKPACVIETLSAEVVPFHAVTPEFAAIEGEGDGSLAGWRDAHIAYFTRECTAAGRTFTEDMPVLCECFRVVYRPGA